MALFRLCLNVLVLSMANIVVSQETTTGTTTTTDATTSPATTNNDIITTEITTMETTMITMTDVVTSALTETTELPVTTTVGPVPTLPTPGPKPPTGTWTVKDDGGGVCMKMRFGARLKVLFTNTSNQFDTAIIDAPTTAFPESKCKDDEPREFKLHFFNDGVIQYFFITLTFSKTASKFSLTEVGNLITIDNSHFKNPLSYSQSWASSVDDNFLNNSVPLGKSFNCNHAIEISAVSLTLTDVLFQPFAEEAQGGFGDSVECKNQSSSNVLTIAIFVVIVIVLLVVAALIVVWFIKKRRGSRPEDLERLTR